MKIIQLTDLHIGAPDEMPYGIDVRSNFLEILQTIEVEAANILVLTGDFCLKQPNLDTYKWIKKQLDNLPIPYIMTPGNHDDLDMMCDVFHLGKNPYPFKQDWKDFQVAFLDSALGTLDKATEEWVVQELDTTKPTILFVHHPMFKMSVPYMDNNHSGNFSPTFFAVLNAFKHLSIFCGHYHIERTLHRNNISVFICPSLYVQIDPKMEDFYPLHYNIGYRTIELIGTSIITSVMYQEGHRKD